SAGKVYRIGYLGAGAGAHLPAGLDGVRQTLRQLGYAEAQNPAVEYRWAGGRDDGVPPLGRGMGGLRAGGLGCRRHNARDQGGKEATRTIPIVMRASGDPVGSGLIASLARPGRNVTGLSALSPALAGKRLQLLKEIIPSSRAWRSSGIPRIHPGSRSGKRR